MSSTTSRTPTTPLRYVRYSHYVRLALLASALLLVLTITRVVYSQSDQNCTLISNAVTADRGGESAPAQNSSYCWALIGNDSLHLPQERAAGIDAKLFSLSWRSYAPYEGVIDKNYVERKQTELAQLRTAGFDVILSMGIHDVPDWVHTNYADTYYVNQFGNRYTDSFDAGDANLVFNPLLRELVSTYSRSIFTDFGTEFIAVRVGGGRYGELTYPPAKYQDCTNCYWAFDANAQALNPVPGWIPGQPSPQGEAEKFLSWYLDALVDFQQWQIDMVRQSYAGPLMILYPSWGLRPGDIERAVAGNLSGTTSAERNGETQRGFDFARQVHAISDPRIIVTTTWLDADASADGGEDPRYWSPVKYLYTLVQNHPLRPPMYGENTGHGQRAEMELSVSQMQKYGLLGMAWFWEEELFSGQYATLADYSSFMNPVGGASAWESFLPFLRP